MSLLPTVLPQAGPEPAGAAPPRTAPAGPGPAGRAAKRAFDLAAALTLLTLLALPLAALGLAVAWQLRRPALFRQLRVTGEGTLAEILKLRTLRGHTDPDTCWSAPLAEATRLGLFLRATHLDELPQLINVVRGELSLVGPRPERPYFARRFAGEIPGYGDRTRMKAGLTGWAQVHGYNGDTCVARRAALDNAYIDNWSFRLDLVILARTVGCAVKAAAGPTMPAGARIRPAAAPHPRGGQQ
jgi:lipopolysaccharide/colanic/teichoic acid biosynthesis glycosyltransferase